jgi:hypothetical protein
MNMQFSLFILLVILVSKVYASDRINVAEIRTLTFRNGLMTTSRRGEPIAQLQCITGECGEPKIESMQCTNSGADSAGNVQWSCEAEVSKGRQFQQTEITCEGYDAPGDPFVLVGSCAMKYSVIKIAKKTSLDTRKIQGEWVIVGFIFVFLLVFLCINSDRDYRDRVYHDRVYHDRDYHDRDYHDRDYHDRDYREREYRRTFYERPVFYNPTPYCTPEFETRRRRSVNTDTGTTTSTIDTGLSSSNSININNKSFI